MQSAQRGSRRAPSVGSLAPATSHSFDAEPATEPPPSPRYAATNVCSWSAMHAYTGLRVNPWGSAAASTRLRKAVPGRGRLSRRTPRGCPANTRLLRQLNGSQARTAGNASICRATLLVVTTVCLQPDPAATVPLDPCGSWHPSVRNRSVEGLPPATMAGGRHDGAC